MFEAILVANRGEIAVRIMATAQKMGIACVAVYSDADRDALHVAMADRAVPIGGAAPADSYLRGEAIIEAALATGAQAIHPGYGFLSENPDFAEAVTRAGLSFVGPSAEVMRAMALKDAAKATMAAAGVPVVPGYHGADQGAQALARAARDIGFPVLIKAVAGGGGKGMRRVDRAGDFAEALDSARAEARAAFGNEAVLVEKFVDTPRHIEVQVFGDGTRALHLFERDCSLQRRHQKVIEEAPAPGMSDELRTAMGQAAVRAAEAIGYAGAGTVEFIADASGGLRPDRFWFMEMNTRLQVEHPVTEAITGVDLVDWQLRVAAGERLPAQQADLAIRGHAVEARLYAEDAAAGFLPATGKLAHLVFPGDVRTDSGVRAGDTISPHYDPMIAKIIAAGPDRETALARLERALRQTEVAGTVTNLDFLARLVGHREVREGRVDTGLIARHVADLTAPQVADPAVQALAALAALGLETGGGPLAGFTLWQPMVWPVRMGHCGEMVTARVRVLGTGVAEVDLDSARVALDRRSGVWFADGEPLQARIHRAGRDLTIFAGGTFRFAARDPLDRAAGPDGEAEAEVRAPMPGLVRDVAVAPGQAVSEGDRLAVLEAMKMEHVLRAVRDGVVAAIGVRAGDQVDAGAVLIRFEDRQEEEEPQ